MKNRPEREERYLSIESPNKVGVIDFLDEAIIRASVENGKLVINVKASHGEGTSSWDEHDFEVELPEKEEARADCDLCKGNDIERMESFKLCGPCNLEMEDAFQKCTATNLGQGRFED